VLPAVAQAELARRGIVAASEDDIAEQSPSEALWNWFGAQPDHVKAQARQRLDAMTELTLLQGTMKMAKSAAVRALRTSTM
jgi:hypothetical protein